MIHMIFELFVSSALICAYTSETPGACAAIGIAPTSNIPATHATAIPVHVLPARAMHLTDFTTLPPRKRNSQKSQEFSFLFPGRRQYTLARSSAQFTFIAYFSRALPLMYLA